MCCSTIFSSLSLVTHTTGMTHLKVTANVKNSPTRPSAESCDKVNTVLAYINISDHICNVNISPFRNSSSVTCTRLIVITSNRFYCITRRRHFNIFRNFMELCFNPFQPRDAIWHHAFHLFLICMPFAHWLQ